MEGCGSNTSVGPEAIHEDTHMLFVPKPEDANPGGLVDGNRSLPIRMAKEGTRM